MVTLRLKVRCRTDVYEMDSTEPNEKYSSGFLKPKMMPTLVRKRKPSAVLT